MSLPVNRSATYPQPSCSRVLNQDVADWHNHPCSDRLVSAQLPHNYQLEEHPTAGLHGIDPLPANLLMVASPSVGMALLLGSFSVLLTFLGLRVCRLTSLIQRRDQRIKKLLAFDSLTSLHNRETLLKIGERHLRAYPQSEIGLLSININQFKSVNSEFGRRIGDELLQQVSHRLKACLGPQETLARTGMDEFSLLLSPYSAQSGSVQPESAQAAVERAKALVQRLLGVIHQPFYVQSQTIRIEASAGIAIMPKEADGDAVGAAVGAAVGSTGPRSFEQLLFQANVALGQAKSSPAFSTQSGANRYAFFVPEMAAQKVRRIQVRRDLARAIEREELRLRYQPIVRFETGKTVGFEVLVRWQHPTLGLLSPDRFLPLAEEMGLMVEIDRWVMDAACQQLMKWQAQQFYPSMSINLSGEQLSRPDVASFVRSLLSRYAISPAQLNLEVTESVLIAEPAQAIETLHQLKEMGLRLSLDDFGTGYSSLEYLHQFPVDVLKIDKSFVNTMSRTVSQTAGDSESAVPLDNPSQISQTQVIVRSILALAEGLGLEVVAEGIECAEQHDQLRQMNCTYGQGNFFAEPVTGVSALLILKASEVSESVEAM